MKRSREKEIVVATTTTKNELSAKKPKLAEVSLFDWLPLELVQKILEEVPWELDGITRLVNSTWYATMDRRWDPRKRKGMWHRTTPCVKWGLQNNAFSLLRWMLCDVKLKAYDEENHAWMRVACRAGNAQTIGWLTTQAAPDRVRTKQVSDVKISLVAQHGDVACYRFVLELVGRQWPRIMDLYQACLGGKLETAKWILEHRPRAGSRFRWHNCFHNVCSGGHSNLAAWLMTYPEGLYEPKELCSSYLTDAIENAHVELASELVKRWKCPIDGDRLLTIAMRSCKVEVVQWVMNVVSAVIKVAFRVVNLHHYIKYRHFDILDVFAVNKMELCITPESFLMAICDDDDDSQSLAMIQWLWQHSDKCAVRDSMRGRVPITILATDRVFQKALTGGHLDVLEWFFQHALGWFSSRSQTKKFGWSILEDVASRRHVRGKKERKGAGAKETLRWLHKRGLVDLSQARVLENGKIWLHSKCQHHDDDDKIDIKRCKELALYLTEPIIKLCPCPPVLANNPWEHGKALGTYLIVRSKSK